MLLSSRLKNCYYLLGQYRPNMTPITDQVSLNSTGREIDWERRSPFLIIKRSTINGIDCSRNSDYALTTAANMFDIQA